MNNEHMENEGHGKSCLPPAPSGGFAVPEGYFDELFLAISQRIDILEEIRPDQSTDFEVPPGYFERLPAEIMNRMERPASEPIPLYRTYFRSALAVAAILTFALLLTRNILPDPSYTGSELSAHEIQCSLDWEDMDEQTLAEAITPSTSDEDQELHDYLLDANIDEYQIDIEI